MSTFERIRSGLPGLDSMLDSIRMGDNVVWQVSSMDDYMHFVTPLCNQLHEEGKELLYMHFSGHPALLQADRKSTRLNSSHSAKSRMPSSA